MNRRLPVTLAAVAALSATGAAVATQSSGQDPAALPELELQMRFKEARTSFVDVPPRMTKRRPSESPGDTAVLRGTLRDAAGARAGTVHGTFTVTGGRSPRTTELTVGTLKLRDGMITSQGIADNTTGSDEDAFAITGGTGRYEGASGTMTATTGRSAVRFALRLR